MNPEELLNKLAQIEEQAKCTLDEFPITLTKERLRMIIALCKYLRAEISKDEPRIVAADPAPLGTP